MSDKELKLRYLAAETKILRRRDGLSARRAMSLAKANWHRLKKATKQ